MSSKTLVWIGLLIGSSLGGGLPLLFGIDLFSYSGMMWGVVGSMIGAVLGVLGAYKLTNF